MGGVRVKLFVNPLCSAATAVLSDSLVATSILHRQLDITSARSRLPSANKISVMSPVCGDAKAAV